MNLVPSRNLPGIFYDIDDANRPCYRDGSPVTVLLRVPESISHCGICGAPTLEHDDEYCRNLILASKIHEMQRAMNARFDAAMLARVTNMAHELFNDSNRTRAGWWKRLWWKLTDRF